jgi:hypothetical protein
MQLLPHKKKHHDSSSNNNNNNNAPEVPHPPARYYEVLGLLEKAPLSQEGHALLQKAIAK